MMRFLEILCNDVHHDADLGFPCHWTVWRCSAADQPIDFAVSIQGVGMSCVSAVSSQPPVGVTAIPAPFNTAAFHPEMTPAGIGLSNRRRDARAAEPVDRNRPSWPALLAERQLQLLATTARAAEADPFVEAAAPYDDQAS